MKKILQRQLDVQKLRTPNFILVGEENEPLPINAFSYEEIEELCAQFTKDMHAKREKKP